METKQINHVVQEIAARYGDSRTAVFEVEAAASGKDHVTLSGIVLDRVALTETVDALAAQFPGASIDSSGVQILRREPARCLAVSTNLAGLHRQPSRMTEMVTQVLNGTVLEHLRDDGSWAFVRQEDGYLGWLQRAYTTPDLRAPVATHMVTAPVALLLAEPTADGTLTSRVFAGTRVHITDLSDGWARTELVGGASGWIPGQTVRPLDQLPQTDAKKRQMMVDAARPYTGVPYQWGGCTISGIDCSGLAQLLYRLCGIELPRDADMQYAAGRPVEPPFQPGDLLYFGSEESKRRITHVGMSIGGWKIVHSSGPRNGVYEDDVQQAPRLRDAFVGANTFLTVSAAD